MRSPAKFILLLMAMVFLLTNMGVGGFHSKEFTHDLDHHGQPLPLAFDHTHVGVFQGDGRGVSDTADEIEHQLLHAMGTLHLVIGSAASFSWDIAAQILVPVLSAGRLPLAAPESPFRPPRSSAFI